MRQSPDLGLEEAVGHAFTLVLGEHVLARLAQREYAGPGRHLQVRCHLHVEVDDAEPPVGLDADRDLTLPGLDDPALVAPPDAPGETDGPAGKVGRVADELEGPARGAAMVTLWVSVRMLASLSGALFGRT